MIKTLRRDEKQVLLGMLDAYIEHLKQTKGKSLLTRIYGLYTFKIEGYDAIDLIIMQNSSKFISNNKKIYEFDIKGSIIGRKNMKKSGTLKDLNLLEI